MKYADYIKQIEIDSLWSGTRHIIWNLDRQVNVLSGINGVGKSTILNKVIKGLLEGNNLISELPPSVKITVFPDDADRVRYDIIRSLDWQLFQLQRKYLDYQVNVGNRMIEVLQKGGPDAAATAQQLSSAKVLFQDMMDKLFADTGKTIIRTQNEIRFSQLGETLVPYQLSSGEKQILAILLTVLIQDHQPYVLFMDEPEVSLHIDWQEQLIDLILQLNPNVQLILTTHSPAVIMNGWMEHVTEVSDITDVNR